MVLRLQINEVPNNGADCRRYDRQPSSVCVGLSGVTRNTPSIPFIAIAEYPACVDLQ